MPTLNITNLSSTQTQVLSPPDGLGVAIQLNPSQSKSVPLTTLQLEELGAGLAALTLSGAISWSTSTTSGVSDRLDALAPLTPDRNAAVTATTVAAPLVTFHTLWAAPGSSGAAADVVMLAALPSKLRVIDALLVTTAGHSSATVTVFSQAAGAGTQLTDAMAAGTGAVCRLNYATATTALTPAAGTGIYVRLSDNRVAGELTLTCRYES